MSIDATALPSELLVTPQPLIGFCGLDIYQNIVHKSVWDAFSANRKADRAAVQFKLLPPTYDFPVAKPKRPSYEWYQPKGILKRNWMLKHLHVLPAVVVVFLDVEWNDPQWSEKQVQCVSTLQSLRNALQERNTRLCLVLLQKATPLPPGEDVLASERAVSLSTACGINSKLLYILPHTEHLMGYALRLESAFLDLAQTYYAQMAKRVRTHRDQLTTAHTTLKIRHQFKLGFVAEMRQDYSTGLKYYTQAYAVLDEVRTTDSNYLEIKTIGGFLNYKICRLMFKLKVPRDAINHFISHIEKYKNRVGYKDLIFEHYGWLSSQHSHFAELFCDAIKNGLPALQTQHPGIYYHKAAEYIAKRREAFQQNYGISSTEPSAPIGVQSNNPMTLYTEFFGVRAGKAGEPISEQQINTIVRDNETAFNHSSAIINLLSQAMSQFKLYKCLRFRKKLAIDMAEEYFKTCDYAKALTLYSLMLPDFRQDNWFALFSDVLLKTLRCALYSVSVLDFVACSIEALSLKIHSEKKIRIATLENLWKVFQSTPPSPQPQFSDEIRELWESSLTSVKSPLQIDMDKIYDIMDIHATFEKSEIKNDEQVRIHVILKLQTDVPLKMHRFSLLLTDGNNVYKLQALKYMTCSTLSELASELNSNLEQVDLETRKNKETSFRPVYQNLENDLKLEPEIYYKLLFSTEAQQFSENTQLRVARIETLMGTDKLSALLIKHVNYTRSPFRNFNRQHDLNDNVSMHPICYIAPTFHLVTQTNFTHKVMLVNEYFPIVTTVNNPHNVFLQNIGINVMVPTTLRNKVFLTTDVSPGRQKLYSQIQIDIGELSMHSSNTVSYYVFSLLECEVLLQQKIWYTIDILRPKTQANLTIIVDNGTTGSADNSPENMRSIVGEIGSTLAPVFSPVQIEFMDENRVRKTREDTLRMQCEPEFSFSGQFYTLNKKPLTKVYRGENFLLRINAEVRSQQDLDILESYFICDHNLVQSTYNFKRKKYTNQYSQSDKIEDVIILRTNSTLEDWIIAKEFERNKKEAVRPKMFGKFLSSNEDSEANKNHAIITTVPTTTTTAAVAATTTIITPNLTSTPNINNTPTVIESQALDDEKYGIQRSIQNTDATCDANVASNIKLPSTRLIYNKTMEAVQATSHCRGFFKSSFFTAEQRQQRLPIFGVYCIKWRRNGYKDENESKFIVDGLDIEIPPLNIYCAIEEKMFVKMPMTFKVVLKNPTMKVLHLIATLNISNTDNFICSGHRQLDISVFANSEKELVYNLYPLCVGWQNLPDLMLEYNTQADPSKDENQNNLLCELMQRSVPKRVYVLPPLKQQIKQPSNT